MSIVINADCFWEKREDEVLVTLPGRAAVVVLEGGVSLRLWELLQIQRDVDELIDILGKEYEADISMIKDDVVKFIQDGLKQKIITKVS